MAVPTKALILKIDTPTSLEYAAVAAESCEDIGLKWEYFTGFKGMRGQEAWTKTGVKVPWLTQPFTEPNRVHRAECCSAGHGAMWKKIAEGDDECVIILEHDAIMLQPVNIDIPDDMIVTLGYKLNNPYRYNHKKAGPPKELIKIAGHEGAHAYAITKNTAIKMIDEIETKNNFRGRPGPLGCIDNAYFIKGQRKTRFPLYIASPTPAMGWLRKSTIWSASSAKNEAFIPSFTKHLDMTKAEVL